MIKKFAPHNTHLSSSILRTETWIFDLDNTLYSATSELFSQIDWNITRFVAKFLNIEETAARTIQKDYFRRYGTTMRGLMNLHDVDPQEFLEYVHNIDLSPIANDPKLNLALDKIPGRKFIFTNGSTAHAQKVIKKLGIEDYFDAIFDIVDSSYIPKPDPGIYEKLCSKFNIKPSNAVMVEDMACNLLPAHNMGMTTVWVDSGIDWSRNTQFEQCIDYKTDDLTSWLQYLTQNPS